MSIRSFSSELKHNLSQTYDIFNDLKIIKSNGVCKGAYNQFERLPSCDQIQKVFRRQIRFIRHSLQEFSFPDLLITPLGKPLEEIINLVNTKENLNLETRFSIKTFNDLNRKIYYYPSYNNLKPIHNNTKLDIINEIEGVFEISILNKPFIAIPLPSAKDNHQMKNAQFYEEMGCCWVLDQRNLKKEKRP